MDAVTEIGRNPVSKHQIRPEYGDEQADAGRIGPYPVGQLLLYVMAIHTYSLEQNNFVYIIHITRYRTTLCVCVCVCFLPIHSGHQVRWTYQPGSHRRKVTQDF